MRSLFVAFFAFALACNSPPREEPVTFGGGDSGEEATEIDREWVAKVVVPDHLERLEPEAEAYVAAAVHALSSQDFRTYASAASGLASLGEPVIPYLGHRGEPATTGARLQGAVSVVLASVFEKVEPEHVAPHLDSPYAAVRAAAARATGELHLMELAPVIVDLLDDERVDVRRAAIRTLRRLCNRYYGYLADGSKSSRASAVRQWRLLLGSR